MSRWWGALAGLLAVALIVVGLPAPAGAATVWGGSFAYAYADNPSPVLDHSTSVHFGVTEPLVNATVHVNDEKGAFIVECSQGRECGFDVNPGPGETKTYTALLRTSVDGHLVTLGTSAVSVTDPGWTGTITPVAPVQSFVTAGSTAWPAFVTKVPRDMADVKVYVDGVLKNTCNAQGGDLYCSANFGMAANTVHVVRADVVAYLGASPREVRATASTIVTSMTPEGLATWLLNPDVDHGALGEYAVDAALAGLGARIASDEFCLQVGLALPAHGYGSTVPDFTLDCNAGTLTVGQIVANIFRVAGVIGGIELVNSIASSNSPTPPTVAGGGRAENMPNVDEHGATCQNFDLAGNCLDPWHLTSLSTAHVAFTADPPVYWLSGTVLCSATYVDPVTGEEQVFKLRTDGLKHILDGHAVDLHNGESIWRSDRFFTGLDEGDLANFEDELLPKDFDRLVQFICTSLAYVDPTSVGPSSVPMSPNTVRTYEDTNPEEKVGKNQAGVRDSKYTLVITPDGDVWTAHPGLPN